MGGLEHILKGTERSAGHSSYARHSAYLLVSLVGQDSCAELLQ